jgi:hypothetical protein
LSRLSYLLAAVALGAIVAFQPGLNAEVARRLGTPVGAAFVSIMINLVAFYGGAEDRSVQEAWVADFAAALRQDDAGAYVNFLADESPERVRAAYPGPTWDRLRQIKRRYDPGNLFRLNQNIPPAA